MINESSVNVEENHCFSRNGRTGFAVSASRFLYAESTLAFIRERNHPRQLLPFEKLQRRSASG